MENSTQLLWRQESALAGRQVLVVDADDPALAGLPVEKQHTHADDINMGAQQWAPLPQLPDDVDLAILPLPKAAERLELLLRSLAGATQTPLEIWLVGPAKGGIRGGVTRLEKYADQVALVDSARHCKLYRGWLRPGPALTLADVETVITVAGMEIVSYPGVFGHGRLDEGSALLLEVLGKAELNGPVLDIGCGSGVLSAALARRGCRLEAVDVSATAVAATLATLERNGLHGQVGGGDLYASRQPDIGRSDVGQYGSALKDADKRGKKPRRFQAIITNPPFHDGRVRTMDTTHRLIQGAPDRLCDDGVLWMVANRELPYAKWLNDGFRQVTVAAENNRFRVYRASR